MGLENNCTEETSVHVLLYICIYKNQEFVKAYIEEDKRNYLLKEEKMARTQKLIPEFN